MKSKKKNIRKSRTTTKNYTLHILLSIIFVVTCIVYSHTVKNGFLNWDDPDMVTNNTQVLAPVSAGSIIDIFSQSASANEYQPLTTLLYHFAYNVFGFDATYFHLLSLIFHLINIYLVFIVIRLLFNNSWYTLSVTALFAVHPLNVEAVAWISSLNYTVFTAFFLLALRYYILFITTHRNTKYLLLSLAFFLFSILAKSTAVIFPLVLFTIDYLYKRKLNLKLFIEKLYYLPISVFFGIIALIHRGDVLKEVNITEFGIIDRLFFALYSVGVYLFKIVFPVNLKILYDYPEKSGSFLPLEYYLIPLLLVLCLTLLFVYFKHERRIMLFGLMFFMVNIIIVIHIIPFYHAGIIAERYVYIAALGIFVLGLHLFYKTFLSTQRPNIWVKIIPLTYLVFLSITSFNRLMVWQDDIAVYDDLIKKSPDIELAYNNRGQAKVNIGDYDGALEDINKALEINPEYVEAFYNRGVIRGKIGDLEGALADCESALDLRPNYAEAFFNRGSLKLADGDTSKDIVADLNKAISLKSDYADAYNNRGLYNSKIGNYEQALSDYEKTLEINAHHAKAFYNRGNLKGQQGDLKSALNDFNKAIEIDPRYVDAFCDRGVVHSLNKSHQLAVSDFNSAIKIDGSYIKAYINLGIVYIEMNRINDACEQFEKAKNKGNRDAFNMFNMYCR